MTKKRYDDELVILETLFLIEHQATYKVVAQHFHMPLSTVGWHIKYRMAKVSPGLHTRAMSIVKHRSRKHTNMEV